jgi:ketosteroid isomerase-like protein
VEQQNVELVQRAYDLWNAGEMEAAKVLFAPHLVMSTPPDWPDAITSSNRDEAFARLVENRSLFKSDRLVPERWIEASDRVIVPTQWCGVPKGASAEVRVYVVPAFTVREGMMVRLDWHQSVEEAIKVVGPEE